MFGGKTGEMLKIARNPDESERIRALAGAFAAIETEQRAALREHAEALDVDPAEVGLTPAPNEEERIEALCAAVGARFGGGAWETWAEHIAPDALDAAAAEAVADLDADGWDEERERIVDEWRADPNLNTEAYTDGQLISADVSSRFGVDVDTFEEYVVGYSPGRLFEQLLAGEFETNTEAIGQLTATVDE
ncbi:hypothetical protein BRC97_07015 [Halobacteriales archaeon QS_6_71_20]|nr:MAG: hypothetical protein BRC97_07015 [Halobacteriales archaeon QS_6_71_20]